MYSPIIPRKNRFTPERNVMARINAVKPCGECSQNFAYNEYIANKTLTPVAAAPSIAAARRGTIEKAKIPSDASFNNLNGLYLVRPARRAAPSIGITIHRNPTHGLLPRR